MYTYEEGIFCGCCGGADLGHFEARQGCPCAGCPDGRPPTVRWSEVEADFEALTKEAQETVRGAGRSSCCGADLQKACEQLEEGGWIHKANEVLWRVGYRVKVFCDTSMQGEEASEELVLAIVEVLSDSVAKELSVLPEPSGAAFEHARERLEELIKKPDSRTSVMNALYLHATEGEVDRESKPKSKIFGYDTPWETWVIRRSLTGMSRDEARRCFVAEIEAWDTHKK